MKVTWNKFIARILTVCLLITMIFPSGYAMAATSKKTYTDVGGHKYEEALVYAINNGLLTNKGTNLYPDQKLTKGQASLSLNALLGATKSYVDMDKVTNLAKGDKYYVTVSRGLNAGYLVHKENGRVYNPLVTAT